MNFPKHAASMTLAHNEHLDYYMTASAWLDQEEERGNSPDWENEEAEARAIATNEIWVLQWYPNTPISSYKAAAPTLEELLAFANSWEFR